MKLPCVGETRAPPIARALQPGAIDQRAGRPRNAVGHRVAAAVGILEDAAGARRLERLRALAERQRLARDRRAAPPARPAERGRSADSSDLAGALQAAAIVAERHRRRRHVDRRAVAASTSRRARDQSPISRPPKCALPKIAPPTVPGVPAQASRPASPWLIVQRTRPLIVTAASARITRPSSMRRHVAAARPDHEPANAGVGDQHVRAAAEHRHRTPASRASLERARTSSRRVRARAASRPAPPTRKVVSGASGASLPTRSAAECADRARRPKVDVTRVAISDAFLRDQRGDRLVAASRRRTQSSRRARAGRRSPGRRRSPSRSSDTRRSSADPPSAESAGPTPAPAATPSGVASEMMSAPREAAGRPSRRNPMRSDCGDDREAAPSRRSRRRRSK